MKKIIPFLCMATLLVITGFSGNNDPLNTTGGKKPDRLPKFSYVDLNGNKFTNNELIKEQRLMIVYFNPSCDICQRETEMIVNNINFFTDIQIVMVSPNGLNNIKKYVEKNKLSNYHQIKVLHDFDDEFYKQFDAIGYPTLYLYDVNRNLITAFETEVEFSDIKDAFSSHIASSKN